MSCLLSALKVSPLGEYLEEETARGVEPQILLRDLLGAGGLKTCIRIGGNSWINEKLVQALVDVVIECTGQDIVFGAFEALQLIFTIENSCIIPGPNKFIEFLQRLGYTREGCVVNWEQKEDLQAKDGAAKFECPVTTSRIHFMLRLIASAFEVNSRVFCSRSWTHSLVDLVCTLIHLNLNVSRHYYEPELELALSSVFTGATQNVVESALGDVVATLLDLGPSHRSQVQMLKFIWGTSQTVCALRQLWCVSLLQKFIPLHVGAMACVCRPLS